MSTFTVTRTFTGPNGQISSSKSVSCEAEFSLEVSIPANSTDLEVVLAIDVSQLKAISIIADGALTLQTNDGTTPDDTIVLVADLPYDWINGDYNALLLTADVTSIFVTNAGSSAVTLIIRGGYDPTP